MCDSFLSIISWTGNGNINHVKILRIAALQIYGGFPLLLSTNIVLDKLHFENINSDPVVHLQAETIAMSLFLTLRS